MVATRQLNQPSVNFREPISTFTVEWDLLISWNSEPVNSRSQVSRLRTHCPSQKMTMAARVMAPKKVVAHRS